MTTVHVADTGVFVRCGGPDNETFRRLRRAVRRADVTLVVPERVYEELGGDPAAEAYPVNMPHSRGFEEGWIAVADDLDHADPLVSTVMDDARRWIANETGREEDAVEKADAALVGLAAQLLVGDADEVVLLTTDKPVGGAAEAVLSDHGFEGQVDYRYASEAYLDTITQEEFR